MTRYGKALLWLLMALALTGATACHTRTRLWPLTRLLEDPRFVVLDGSLRDGLAFALVEEARDAEAGRYRIVVRVENTSGLPRRVELRTLWRDEANVPLDEQTPWTLVALGIGETHEYRAEIESSEAANFTVRARLARR